MKLIQLNTSDPYFGLRGSARSLRRHFVSRGGKLLVRVRPVTFVEYISSVISSKGIAEGLLGIKEPISTKIFSVKHKTKARWAQFPPGEISVTAGTVVLPEVSYGGGFMEPYCVTVVQ